MSSAATRPSSRRECRRPQPNEQLTDEQDCRRRRPGVWRGRPGEPRRRRPRWPHLVIGEWPDRHVGPRPPAERSGAGYVGRPGRSAPPGPAAAQAAARASPAGKERDGGGIGPLQIVDHDGDGEPAAVRSNRASSASSITNSVAERSTSSMPDRPAHQTPIRTGGDARALGGRPRTAMPRAPASARTIQQIGLAHAGVALDDDHRPIAGDRPASSGVSTASSAPRPMASALTARSYAEHDPPPGGCLGPAGGAPSWNDHRRQFPGRPPSRRASCPRVASAAPSVGGSPVPKRGDRRRWRRRARRRLCIRVLTSGGHQRHDGHRVDIFGGSRFRADRLTAD
jgi:hypothetical protein